MKAPPQTATRKTCHGEVLPSAQPERFERFCRVVLDTALGQKTGGDALLDAVCSGRGALGLTRIGISPEVPVVAVGAPVKIYYGEVGRRLAAKMVFPDFCDVANAVGAATGVVARTVTITVEGDGSGLFRLHGLKGTQSFGSGAEALAEAAGKQEVTLHVDHEQRRTVRVEGERGGLGVDCRHLQNSVAAITSSEVETQPKTPPCMVTMASAAVWLAGSVAPVQSLRIRHS